LRRFSSVKNFSRFISDEHCGLTLAANGKMSIFAKEKSGVRSSTPNDFAHHGRHGDQDGQAEQAV